MPSAYYRTDDPVENFKIRIGIREFETRRHFSHLEQSGQNISDLLNTDAMMYTYVNKDYFTDSATPPVAHIEGYESFLGAAVSAGGAGSTGREGPSQFDLGVANRQKGLSGKLFRDKPYKSMHICLATDIDKAGLTAKPAWGLTADYSSHFKEHILCTIRLYQDGLMEVSPSLSGISEEILSADGQTQHTGDASHGAAVSLFMTDRTAEAALKKGFLLSTFRVRSDKGDEFEYAVYNTHEVLIPHKIEDIMKAQRAQDAIRSGQNIGGVNWKQDPPPMTKHKTITYYAEIVSGSGFEGDRLYVNYKVKVPRGWELRVGNLSDGAANKDGVNLDGEIDLNSKKSGANKVTSSLRGTTHTARVSDGPMGTSLRMSLLRPRFSGVRVAHALSSDRGTRFIVGGALCGVEYPFWIVPALAIIFSLGYGTHGGNVQTALLKRKHKIIQGSSLSLSQRGKTHSHKQREVVGSSQLASDVAVFNHPLSFSFDLNDEEDVGVDFSSVPPVIQLQVYSLGWFGRHKLCGYGFLTMSTAPSCGAVDCEVTTWKPRGGIHSQMNDFFLGNSVRLRDADFADFSMKGQNVKGLKKGVGALNKFGFLSETAGTLRLRSQVVIADPRIVANRLQAQATRESNSAASGTQLKRTVQDILQTFKSTTGLQRSIAANSTASLRSVLTESQQPGSTTNSGARPSISNILDTLNADSKASKVADILARARAKTAKNKRDAEEKKAAAGVELAPIRGGVPTNNTPSSSSSSSVVAAGGIAAYDPHIEKTKKSDSNNNNNNTNNTSNSGNNIDVTATDKLTPPSGDDLLTTPMRAEKRGAKSATSSTAREDKKGNRPSSSGAETPPVDVTAAIAGGSRSITPSLEDGGVSGAAEAKTPATTRNKIPPLNSSGARKELPALTTATSSARKGSGGSVLSGNNSERGTPFKTETVTEEEGAKGDDERNEQTPLLSRQGSAASGANAIDSESSADNMTRVNLTRPNRNKSPPVAAVQLQAPSHRYDNSEHQDEEGEEEEELIVIKSGTIGGGGGENRTRPRETQEREALLGEEEEKE
eukprot:gene25544-32014_t